MEEEPEYYFIDLPEEEIKTEYASFTQRALAYIIDFALFYFILFQIFSAIYLSMIGLPANTNFSELQAYFESHIEAAGKAVIGLFAGSVIFFFYFALFEKEFGATLGKMIVKIKVVCQDGKNLSWGQAILRNLTKTIMLPLLPADLLGMLWTAERQRFSDILAGTKVIYKSKLNLIYEEMI